MTPFYWLAGADSEALEQCSVSEKIKIGGIGSLVLIPPILGSISMPYFLSTVMSGDYYLPYILGFLWGIAVLFIDRHLVAISYNLKTKSIETDNLWGATAKSWGLAFAKLAVRVIFAIGIGITVSHPLVLRIFDSSITEYLSKQKQEEVKIAQNQGLTKIDNLNQQIRAKEEMKRCYEKWLSYEQSGSTETAQPCGLRGSGISGCGNRCDGVKEAIKGLDNEIADLRKSIEPQIKQVEESGKIERESLDKNFSMDYLKRANTLSKISEKEPHINLVTKFLIIFFIFVDIMPIAMKMMTNTEEFENEVNMARIKKNLMHQATNEAYNAVVKQNTKDIQEQLQKYEDTKKSVDNIMQVSCDLLEITGNKYDEFEKKRESYKEKIKNLAQDEKDVARKYLIEIKDIFVAGIDLALKKAKEVIFEKK